MRIFILLLFLLCQLSSVAQLTKVRGQIKDVSTGEAMPFVNISFTNTSIGVISDIEGNYYIETRNKVDSIVFSYVGYQKESRPIRANAFQEMYINLTPLAISLQEIIIRPEKNPALILLDSLNKYRKENNPDRLENWESEIYNKMEFDISNIGDDFKNNRLLKQFKFVFEYMDTSVISGKNYLPIFITETVSNLHYQKNPKKEKEIIKASNISGVKDDQLSQFMGQMYLKVNPYDNFIQLFGKGFVSPIARFGPLYYKYYLIDSSCIDNKWCYQISYLPRQKQQPTFSGDFWIHDTTYALCRINAQIAQDANLNFVNDLVFSLDYEHVNDSIWFAKLENTFIDFNISDRTSGIFGKKTTSYKNTRFDVLRDEKFFNPQLGQELITLDGINDLAPDKWVEMRHLNLTEKEIQIFDMVDSIKQVPIFKTWVDVINTVIKGYYIIGLFEIGPYYKLYSFNAIEGNRFRFGGRTSNDLSKKVLFTGHVAYGDKDKRWKFAQGGLYMFNKNPRRSAGWDIKHDIEQLGISQNAFTQDNILASFLRRTYNKKLTLVDEIQLYIEHEWYQGLSNKVNIKSRQIWATQYVPFIVDNFNDNTIKELNVIPTTEITVNTRYAYNEKFIMGEFERVSLGTHYPIFNLDLTAGIKGILNSQYDYYRIHASIDHGFNINPIGRFRYILDGSFYIGTAPYPLLQIHEGNETYSFDDYAFNMMNYYEFASDKYLSLLVEHHFDGFFFNRVPFFRKLKWREVVSAKSLIGRVSEKNLNAMRFPDGMRQLSKPYGEASIGIENIFRLFRIDAMWRLSYLSQPAGSENMPTIPRFGIRAQMKFEF